MKIICKAGFLVVAALFVNGCGGSSSGQDNSTPKGDQCKTLSDCTGLIDFKDDQCQVGVCEDGYCLAKNVDDGTACVLDDGSEALCTFGVCGSCNDDGRCEPESGENCITCAADCGDCCGNGICEAELGEDCETCRADCSCLDGETCVSQGDTWGCESADQCEDECELGEIKCDGNVLVECVAKDGCHVWLEELCTEGCDPDLLICKGCPTPCAAGEFRCDDKVKQQCAATGPQVGCVWETIETCPCACSLGECVVECQLGERRCNQNQLERCSADGCKWELLEECSCGCADGACDDSPCLAGMVRCSPNQTGNLEKCSDDGCGWQTIENCECGCAEGQCLVGECSLSSKPQESDTQTIECGNCGEQEQSRTRTCTEQCTWNDWGPWQNVGNCKDQGACEKGSFAKEIKGVPCDKCGTQGQERSRTCSDTCSWGEWSSWINVGTCSGQKECNENDKDVETKEITCGNCGTQTQERSRTCSAQCNYGGWSQWSNVGGCENQGCEPGTFNCLNNNNWLFKCDSQCKEILIEECNPIHQTCNRSIGSCVSKCPQDSYEAAACDNNNTANCAAVVYEFADDCDKWLSTIAGQERVRGRIYPTGDTDYYQFKVLKNTACDLDPEISIDVKNSSKIFKVCMYWKKSDGTFPENFSCNTFDTVSYSYQTGWMGAKGCCNTNAKIRPNFKVDLPDAVGTVLVSVTADIGNDVNCDYWYDFDIRM